MTEMIYRAIRPLSAVAFLAIVVCLTTTTHAQTPPPAVTTTTGQKPVTTTTGQKPAPPSGATTESTVPPKEPSSQTRSACQRRVDVLSGRSKDRTLLSDPEVKSLAERSPELTICGAVAVDSGEWCKLLDKSRIDACHETYAIFHQLRAYPNGRSFMFDDRHFQECSQNAAVKPICEQIREALRAGDPNKCV